MDTQQQLDRSSPIVQRVLRLRERMARQDAVIPPGERSGPADVAQTRKIYQWQMWQKSDLSAYAGDASGHRCKR